MIDDLDQLLIIWDQASLLVRPYSTIMVLLIADLNLLAIHLLLSHTEGVIGLRRTLNEERSLTQQTS